MATNIVVPDFGESVVEATVGHWLKAEGEAVAMGEPVVELETEKVNTEIAADESGVLTNIVQGEGAVVRPGDVLGVIDPTAQAAAPSAAVPASPATVAAEAPDSSAPAPETGAPPEAQVAQPEEAPTDGAPQEAEASRVSPVAQRLAGEFGVDLAQIRGSGPGGRVMKEDVESFVRERLTASTAQPAARAAEPPPSPGAAPPPAPAAAPPPRPPVQPARPAEGGRPEVRQRMSRRRLTIARRLVEAQQTAAMLTTFNEIDMNAVVELRRRRREAFKEATGASLGFMSFFVKAVVGALKAFPQINSELQGEELVMKEYYDIGIAIGDPEGLVVPVLRDADRMSFAQIEKKIAELAQKANDRSLSLEDLRGGTFTITNGGVFGSMLSTPILNPPQVGILGMHNIAQRPVAIEGEVVIHPVMYVALTYDHRVVDGRDSVLFLVRVKELIEDPERLLLEG